MSSRVVPESTVTTSVRGTITARTMVSPMSNTDWISSASESSRTSASLARATNSRKWRSSISAASSSSSSVRVPGAANLAGNGPSTRVSTLTRPAVVRAVPTSCRAPTWRGDHTTSSSEARPISTVAVRTDHHVESKNQSSSRAAATAEAVSAKIRQNRSACRCSGSWAMTVRIGLFGFLATIPSASLRER